MISCKHLMLVALCSLVNVVFARESTHVYQEEMNALRAAYDMNKHALSAHAHYAEMVTEYARSQRAWDESKLSWLRFKLHIWTKNFVTGLLPIYPLMIQEEYCPQLCAYIKRISEKANVTVPLAFLAHDIEVENACAAGTFGRPSGVMFIFSELFDNHDDETIEAIVAHELGHIQHNDVAIWNIAVRLGIFYAAIEGSEYVAATLAQRFDLDAKTVMVAKTVGGLGGYVGGLLFNMYLMRRCERAADRFGLEMVDGNIDGFEKFFGPHAEKEQLRQQAIYDFGVFVDKNLKELGAWNFFRAKMSYYLTLASQKLGLGYFFRTHPTCTERMEAFHAQAAAMKAQADTALAA